jgi:DNA repair exonuclease SbcCD ATPase subunit
MPMRIPQILIALTAAAILAACTSQKEPAENAVARVEASLDDFRADAQQFASEQLQTVESSVKRLKDNLEKKDYGAVVQGAPSVSSEVAALKAAVADAKANAEAMQAAAQSEWNDLSASVPPMVEKLQARVDQLNKTRKYPKGMDKAAFEAAKSGFETLKTEWTEATAEFSSGHAPDAVRKARSAKAKAEELINQLEIQV